jgi:hypothetical protein
MEKIELQPGDKVSFEYYTETKCVTGKGKIVWATDTDCCVKTRSKTHIMQIDALTSTPN